MRKKYELENSGGVWTNTPYFGNVVHGDIETLKSSIVGMSDIDAIMFLQTADYDMRIVKENNIDISHTKEIDDKRINVAINENVVTEIIGIF